MTVFGQSRLGRIGYVIMCLLMLAFDFGKEPVQRYIMKLHDQAASDAMKPGKIPQAPADLGRIKGKDLPFMLKGHENAIREIVNSPTKLSKEEIRKRLQDAIRNTPLTFQPNFPIDRDIRQAEANRETFSMLYVVAVIAMTAVTIIGLLWMVSARLRDIGWPQYYLWILLAPVFLPKVMGLSTPHLMAQGVNILFLAAVFGLALIPSEGTGGDAAKPPSEPQPSLKSMPAVTGKGRRHFGRLGAS